jgi:Chitobiase/beta-hexosaminidase C-terminal domain/Fn3 associated
MLYHRDEPQALAHGLRMRAVALIACTGVLVAVGCGGGSGGEQPTATPAFTPAAGTYTSSQTVTVSDTTPGAALYCTVDGSAPNAASSTCPEPMTVSKSEKVRAIAIAPGHAPSQVSEASYEITLPKAATPTFAPAPGTYTTVQSVNISDATTGALIYYTLDGSQPTSGSTLFTGPITVTASETVRAIAVAAGYNYSSEGSAAYLIHVPAPTPVISTPSGSNNTIFGTPLVVTIADADASATIYYAVGSAATTSSTRYTGPISVSSPETIHAIAVDDAGGFSQSAEASQAFTVTDASPTFSHKAGTIPYGSQITLSDLDPNATIYYTTGTASPTTSSPVYTGPLTITSDQTINAIALNPAAGYLQSAEASEAYLMPNPTPAPTIAAGGMTSTTYPATFTVTITDTDSAAAIYYTIDGSTPSMTHGTQFSGPFTVAQTETVNTIAVDAKGGNPPSSVATQMFTVVEATPVISPPAGSVASGSRITITDADPGATIYYTTNGTAATTSSNVYSGPFTINAAETINAIAINTKPGSKYAQSANVSAAYTIATPVPTPVIVSAGGATSATYPSTITVSITDSDATASVFYTLDGSVPGPTNGIKYSGGFTVSSTETVSAMAADSSHGYTNSAVASQAFTIVEAEPSLSPPAGTVTSGTKVTITDADPNAAIYYTTNGSSATIASTRYTGPITLNGSTVINAVAANNGAGTIYTQSVDASADYQVLGGAPTPTISAAGGSTTITYPSTFSVTISDTDATATIYYTTDGSAPGASNGTKYTGAFTVSSTLLLTAVATDSAHGYTPSAASSQQLTIVEAKPVISPAGGAVSRGTKVTITDADPQATLYYSSDGNPATTASTKYTGAITLDSSTTINAIAINTAAATNYTQSLDASAAYTIGVALTAPVINTAGNITTTKYPSVFQVTITDSDASANIYYTTDGTTPSASNGAKYSAPFNVSSTETLTAIAIDNGQGSGTTTQLLTVVEATPRFTPEAGLISSGTQVSISDADPGAAIYYTTDGTPASTSSAKYTSPIAVPSQLTINAVAINTAAGSNYTLSEQVSASYTPYSGSTISGSVVSGTLPVAGATVQLYAAGTSGYGKGAKALTTVPTSIKTGTAGGFSLGYTCPPAPGDQLYLVAAGGSTTGSGSESSIALMVTLGSCSKLAASSSATINELTTIASAYSLSGFAASNSGGGILVGAPAPSTTCTSGGVSIAGKSSCNYRGLANALRTPSNLVDTGSGAALTTTEFYSGNDPNNPNGWSSTYGDPSSTCPGPTCLSSGNVVPAPALNTSTAPYQRVNTLGNVLASCVDEPGNCAALFALTGGSADTLQAALYIAQHPGAWSGKAGLYSLITSPSAPFSPPYGNSSSTLSMEPNDWTLAISITGAGLGIDPQVDFNDYLTNQGLAIDANGNVWVTASALGAGIGTIAGTVAGFDPLGEALTPPTSLVSGLVAYDSSTGYSSYGGFGPDVTSHHVSGVGVFTQPNSFLVDSAQHLWVSNNSNTQDPGGSEVTIAKTTAPGVANLSLSSASPSFDLPDEGISFLADNNGNLWQTIESTDLWEYDKSGNFTNLVSLFPSGPNVYAFCNAVFDTNATLWIDDCGAPGDGGQVFAVSPGAGQVLGTYNGAYTQMTASGTLTAGSGGNVYACNSGLTGYLVFNTSNLTAPVHTFAPPNKRCGQFLTVDGAGHIWSYADLTTGSVLDELDSNGNQLTPNTGLTATSPEETAAAGLAVFNESSYSGQGGMAIDGSGNLWFLNGVAGSPSVSITPANALVEFIGVASPIVTPTAVATQNGAQGTKP